MFDCQKYGNASRTAGPFTFNPCLSSKTYEGLSAWENALVFALSSADWIPHEYHIHG